jgi:alcohol dehydrogenase class IV
MSFEIQIPSILILGGGSFARVPEVLTRLHCTRPLIVTDSFLVSTGLSARLRDAVIHAGLECGIFSETVSDPTTEVVEAGARAFIEGNHDSLIGLGGGSPIDTAKAIGMLVGNGGRVRDYKVPQPIPKSGPPHIAVPTTAGTGSEVTRFTVITDSASQEKMLIAGSPLLPSAAVVDYELTLSMPARLTADTGIDSLTHSIESYVSRKANSFSDVFALQAMKKIWQHLPSAYHHPDSREAREAMMEGATLAGIAFSNASVALVHGMSRPIGAFFHVPHGLSNAMLLPAVTAFSAEAAPARYAECARSMGIASDQCADHEAVVKLIRALFERNHELGVPSPKQYGIPEERFFEVVPIMAAQALASGSPQNNPRVPTASEIEQIYRDAWS